MPDLFRDLFPDAFAYFQHFLNMSDSSDFGPFDLFVSDIRICPTVAGHALYNTRCPTWPLGSPPPG